MQINERHIGEHSLPIDNLEVELSAIQIQVKRSVEEERKTVERSVEILRVDIASCQNNLIGVLRSELISIHGKYREEARQTNQNCNQEMNCSNLT